jgi:hypothetical protein
MKDLHVCLPVELSPQAQKQAAKRAVEERPDNAPHWKALSDVVAAGVPQPEAAVFLTRALWPQNRKIKASFLDVGSSAQDQIRHQLEELYSYTSLSLEWVTRDGEIRISNTPGIGSWSYMGVQCLQIRSGPTMNYGWLDGGVIYHEGGHSLGMGHGHKNPKTPWQWDEQQVYADLMGPPNNWSREQIKHNVIDRYSAEEVSASDPDYDSVMTYAVPNRWTIGDYEVERNTELSARDIEWLQKTYPSDDPDVRKPVAELPRVSLYRFGEDRIRDIVERGDTVITVGHKYEDLAVVRMLGRFWR